MLTFDEWDARFVKLWAQADAGEVTRTERLFYFNNGYTPGDAVRVCSDVDPTNY